MLWKWIAKTWHSCIICSFVSQDSDKVMQQTWINALENLKLLPISAPTSGCLQYMINWSDVHRKRHIGARVRLVKWTTLLGFQLRWHRFRHIPPLDALEFLRWLLMKILVTLSFLPYPSQGWEDTSILHNLMPSHIHARLLHPRSHLEQCDWHRNVLGDFRRQKDPCDDHWAPFQYLHPFLDAYSNKGNWRKRRQ